ncbi:MAG: hypothetical protein K2L78_04995 [Muribaculaceae bacterium]|nr:hypothetical protein [Muribaculaceae bacterium]
MDFKEGLRSTKGRNILTFFVFLAISTVFWFLLALNDDVQEDYKLPVTLEDFPSDVTILSGYNPVLSLTVKDKGSSLMKFSWGHTPKMKLRYEDFSRPNDTTLLLSSSQLNSAVRGIFGTGATIVSMRPDSLKLSYTTQPGVKVAVNIRSDIRTLPQYIYSGHGIASADSVMLYSNSSARFKVHYIPTKLVTLADLTDTVTVDAKLEVPPGMRAVPSTIKVSFPVEPLVSKQQSVPVEVKNVPYGERVVTFPSMIDVSYLLPKSLYGGDAIAIKAVVDYNDITSASKTLPVTISKLPSHCRGVSVHPSEVEYVVERVD